MAKTTIELPEELKRQVEIAAKLDPENPDVQYELGTAYVAAGRKAEGKSRLEIARRLKEKAQARTSQ